jgi:hypothetical protein
MIHVILTLFLMLYAKFRAGTWPTCISVQFVVLDLLWRSDDKRIVRLLV